MIHRDPVAAIRDCFWVSQLRPLVHAGAAAALSGSFDIRPATFPAARRDQGAGFEKLDTSATRIFIAIHIVNHLLCGAGLDHVPIEVWNSIAEFLTDGPSDPICWTILHPVVCHRSRLFEPCASCFGPSAPAILHCLPFSRLGPGAIAGSRPALSLDVRPNRCHSLSKARVWSIFTARI